MSDSQTLKPALKWVGGKRQLLAEIKSKVPSSFSTYCEPFLGGGAVAFSLHHENAVLSDINSDLMNFYEVVRDSAKELIDELNTYRNEEDFYYTIRNADRDEKSFALMSEVKKAARIYYLNRLGYNGLYRVNRKGLYNVPYGHYKKPFVPETDCILALSEYLNYKGVVLKNCSYRDVFEELDKDSFVYIDPPYDNLTTTSFTSYSKYGFSRDDQMALRDACVSLDKRHIRFMLSNSSTPYINEIYKGFNITTVHAMRYVNSDGSNRGKVEEVIITNY